MFLTRLTQLHCVLSGEWVEVDKKSNLFDVSNTQPKEIAMKKLLLSLTLAVLCSHDVRAQFQLNAGESVTFEVNPSQFALTGTAGAFRAYPNLAYWLNYDASTLDAGDALLCQFNGAEQTLNLANPRYSNIAVDWNGVNGQQGFLNMQETFQGTFTFTMQSGSMVINDFRVGVGTPISLTVAQTYLAIVPVPEPGTFALFGLGAILIPAARCLKRRTTAP